MNGTRKVKVFVEGRYRKLTRDLPQTVFFCPECKGHPRRRRGCEKCEGFGKLTKDSVQELVGWVLGKGFGTRKHKFHGAGREDVDVRMLGRGRPFVLELENPKELSPDLAALETLVNDRNEGRLEIEGLYFCEKARVRILKESKFAKAYRALVAYEGELDLEAARGRIGERVDIEQETPSRVAHRRADKIRERWIELRAVEPGEAEGTLVIDVATEHGTYVKEFVSGEEGRTRPGLGDLFGGLSCRCVELDVLGLLEENGGDLPAPQSSAPQTRFGAGLE